MQDNEFWSKVWKYCITAFCVFIVLCFASCQVDRITLTVAVTKSTNPIATKCAMDGIVSREMLCYEAAKKPN